MTQRTLTFINRDAAPKKTVIRCDTASVPLIMAWYGGFYAGDDYRVKLDGKRVRIDLSGEPIGDLP